MSRPRLSRAGAVYLLGAGASVPVAPRPTRPPPAPGAAPAPGRAVTRVLGLDLAMGCTGWCLLVGGQPAAHGVFELPGSRRKDEGLASHLGRRATELGRQVGLLVSTHRPQVVGYEYPDVPRPHYSGGTKGREHSAVQGLSRAEGFLVALWPQVGGSARLVAVPMTAAKRATTGRPGATKDQVLAGLLLRPGWDIAQWPHDAIDAGAVALAVYLGGVDV